MPTGLSASRAVPFAMIVSLNTALKLSVALFQEGIGAISYIGFVRPSEFITI